MGPAHDGSRVAVFGPFRFDPSSRELRKNELRLRLEEKSALVLHHLIENAGTIITRGELQKLLWPSGVHVDFDHGLDKSINRLRGVIGDDPDRPRYIETLRGRGYRFIGEVQFVLQSATARSETAQASSVERYKLLEDHLGVDDNRSAFLPGPLLDQGLSNGSILHILSRISRKRPWSVALAIAGVLALGLTLSKVQANRGLAPPISLKITFPASLRLMTTSENLGLALSPDGKRILFVASEADENPKLWIRRLDSAEEEALPGTDGGSFPFWSPDGKEIRVLCRFCIEDRESRGSFGEDFMRHQFRARRNLVQQWSDPFRAGYTRADLPYWRQWRDARPGN